ncbi:MAG: YdcF family protein [Gemmatimonadota bacterium]
MIRRAARVLATLAVGVVVVWLASLAAVLVAGARPTIRPAGAILVLGAAQYNGRPSPVLQARLDHAIDLYNRGLAPRVIMTGGVGHGDSISEAEVSRRYAVAHGVPDSAILTERLGTTSAESVEAAAGLMRAESITSALVVSDSYHMMRLELLVRRAGIQPYRAPAPDAPIDHAARRTRWRYVLRESVLVPAAAVLGGF